jgi:hypothetical protein
MEPEAALAQPRSTPNSNGNAAFLNILLKDDDKVVWLWSIRLVLASGAGI